MSRYYFHIRDGQTVIPDEEGMECRTVQAVDAEARASAQDMANAALRSRLNESPASIQVEDESGNIWQSHLLPLWLN